MRPVRTVKAGPWSDQEREAYDRLVEQAIETLNERVERLEIPIQLFDLKDPETNPVYAPCANSIVVCRVPPPPAPQTHGASSIFIPEVYQAEYEREPESRGVLISCGLGALDTFRSHGVLPGDWVKFGRFDGWEEEIEKDREGKSKKKLLQLKDHGVLGSFDLAHRLWSKRPTMEVVYELNPDGSGMHTFRPVPAKTTKKAA